MKAWVFLCNDSPLEHWMEGYKQRFDAWEDGGVRGLAVGRLRFQQEDGSSARAFVPDPKVYDSFGVSAPSGGGTSSTNSSSDSS